MRRHVLLAFLLAAWPGLAGAETASPAGTAFRGCGTHAEVMDWLGRQFGETPLARGLQGDGRVFEMFAAKAGASWTMVITDPAGESCIVSEGTDLELLAPHAPPVA